MTLSITRLAGNQALVQGEDVTGAYGRQILSTCGLDYVDSIGHIEAAQKAYDKTVKEFYKPLTKASKKLEEERAAKNKVDPRFVIVLEEGTPATPGKKRDEIYLDESTVILRLIDADGDTDQVIWATENRLAVVAV